MTKDTVVAFRAPEGFSPDPLTDLLRQGARDLIVQAVDVELNAFLSAHADQTDAVGRRRLVRHGHLPEREVQTGIGAVSVKVPRIRDRAPEGSPLKFTSTILPPYPLAPSRASKNMPCQAAGSRCVQRREAAAGQVDRGVAALTLPQRHFDG